MSILLDLFSSASAETVEGLTGESPIVSMDGEISGVSDIPTPITSTKVTASDGADGEMIIYMPINIATALADAMLGGDGEASDSIDDDGLDSTKEIVSQVIGSINTAMSSQNDIPVVKFEVTDISVVNSEDEFDDSMSTIFDFDYSNGNIEGHIYMAVEDSLVDIFNSDGEEEDFGDGGLDEDEEENLSFDGSDGNSFDGGMSDFGDDSNMNLILDVKLPIKVRIGSKKMLLKDVINMDIGAVIELDRLVNDPLDLLVEDTVIGQGEVVIVDGNFGIQISKILTQSERIARLRD